MFSETGWSRASIKSVHAEKQKGLNLSIQSFFYEKWRPQGDLNPCRLRERQVSWARLDDGDAS